MVSLSNLGIDFRLPNFAVGEVVLVARVRRSGLTPKLLMTWTGP